MLTTLLGRPDRGAVGDLLSTWRATGPTWPGCPAAGSPRPSVRGVEYHVTLEGTPPASSSPGYRPARRRLPVALGRLGDRPAGGQVHYRRRRTGARPDRRAPTTPILRRHSLYTTQRSPPTGPGHPNTLIFMALTSRRTTPLASASSPSELDQKRYATTDGVTLLSTQTTCTSQTHSTP